MCYRHYVELSALCPVIAFLIYRGTVANIRHTEFAPSARLTSTVAMAPPPPANQPLQQRLIQLATTLQFGWFAGHVTLLLCTIRYSLSYITFNYYSRWSRFSYRTAFVAAAVTYGIVVFKSLRARQRSGKGQGSPAAILADENVQYLSK